MGGYWDCRPPSTVCYLTTRYRASLLQITNCSSRHASPCLWNHLLFFSPFIVILLTYCIHACWQERLMIRWGSSSGSNNGKNRWRVSERWIENLLRSVISICILQVSLSSFHGQAADNLYLYKLIHVQLYCVCWPTSFHLWLPVARPIMIVVFVHSIINC